MYTQSDLERIRGWIKFYKDLVNKHPLSKEYADSLYEYQQWEVDIINQIGRK